MGFKLSLRAVIYAPHLRDFYKTPFSAARFASVIAAVSLLPSRVETGAFSKWRRGSGRMRIISPHRSGPFALRRVYKLIVLQFSVDLIIEVFPLFCPTILSASFSITPRSVPSSITRILGSVPERRTSTRPSPRGSFFHRFDNVLYLAVVGIGRLSLGVTTTFLRVWGYIFIISARRLGSFPSRFMAAESERPSARRRRWWQIRGKLCGPINVADGIIVLSISQHHSGHKRSCCSQCRCRRKLKKPMLVRRLQRRYYFKFAALFHIHGGNGNERRRPQYFRRRPPQDISAPPKAKPPRPGCPPYETHEMG